MPLISLLTLPVRLAVAATETTLALGQLVDPEGPIRRRNGYADRVMLLIGEGGLVERAARVLSDPRGPMSLLNTVAELLDQERPIGRIFAEGGAVERLVEEGGALDQLVADDGPLERLLRTEGALDRITRPGGALDRLLSDDGLLDRLLSEEGFVERLTAEGGTLEQLVALGATLERIQPRLDELIALIPELHSSVTTLNTSVGPLGDLANRLPGNRRRPALEG
jgi:hypothetical protein